MDPPPCCGLRTKQSSVAAASTSQRAVSIVRTTGRMAQIGMDRVEIFIACAAWADSIAGLGDKCHRATKYLYKVSDTAIYFILQSR